MCFRWSVSILNYLIHKRNLLGCDRATSQSCTAGRWCRCGAGTQRVPSGPPENAKGSGPHLGTKRTGPVRTPGRCGRSVAGPCGGSTAGHGDGSLADLGIRRRVHRGTMRRVHRGATPMGLVRTAGRVGRSTAGQRGGSTVGNRGTMRRVRRWTTVTGPFRTPGRLGGSPAGRRGVSTAGRCGASTAGRPFLTLTGVKGEDPERRRNATEAKCSSACGLHRRPLESLWRRNSASQRFPGHGASTKRFPDHGVAVRDCADSCTEPNSHRTSARSSCNPTVNFKGRS
ncbi:uncharacterized protein LOC142851869 [Microtus pennsylvanicus]|uniref:uncharacterized protein LOC142851869 n=1 Tax=Microtus pennsylvanicus TaxID=10058 RepID=UPI003F6C01F6